MANKRDFTPLSYELNRKHELIHSIWDGLDVKIGLLLGFTVVVLLQITVSSEVVSSVGANAHLLWPPSWTLAYIVNAIEFVLFWLAIASFGFTTYVGIKAIDIRPFEDISTIEEAERFKKDPSCTNELFNEHLGMELCNCIKKNKECIEKKAVAVRRMITPFICGTILFLSRFILIVLSNNAY